MGSVVKSILNLASLAPALPQTATNGWEPILPEVITILRFDSRQVCTRHTFRAHYCRFFEEQCKHQSSLMRR